MTIFDIPSGKLCTNCEEHLATEIWIGHGDMMALIHGHYKYWCKCCTLEAQIEYAKIEWIRLRKSIIPLEAELKSACKKT